MQLPVYTTLRLRVKKKIAGTGEAEVTGVGGDATTVVTEVITAGVNDVTVTGVIGLTYDR